MKSRNFDIIDDKERTQFSKLKVCALSQVEIFVEIFRAKL